VLADVEKESDEAAQDGAGHDRSDAGVYLLPGRELLLVAEALLEPVRLLSESVVLLLNGLRRRDQGATDREDIRPCPKL
jgi:hypothetical protein